MPPRPVFSSPRNQATAVAVLSGLFLVGVAGLAKLQAGDGPAYLNTPTERPYRLTQPQHTGAKRAILIDTPADWLVDESDPSRFIFTDPDRPARSITLTTGSLHEQPTPKVTSLQFFEQQLEPEVRETFEPIAEPFGFTLDDPGLVGVQLIGVSHHEDGGTRQHLLACLIHGGNEFWWIYLTDTVGADEDPVTELRANARMLQAMYRSAHVVRD